MSELIPLDYKGNAIRIIRDGDELWWVACDIATAIGHSNASTMTACLDADEKGFKKIETLGGEQSLICVNEAGLYTSIIRSHKPQAKAFRRWVTHDVLPTIRKTGKYVLPAVETNMQRLDVIERGRSLLLAWNGLDERTVLAINDRVRDLILLGNQSDPVKEPRRLEIPVTDRARQLGYDLERSQQIQVGRILAKSYRARHGKEPAKREQYVDGTTREVNCYNADDLDLMDDAIKIVVSRNGVFK